MIVAELIRPADQPADPATLRRLEQVKADRARVEGLSPRQQAAILKRIVAATFDVVTTKYPGGYRYFSKLQLPLRRGEDPATVEAIIRDVYRDVKDADASAVVDRCMESTANTRARIADILQMRAQPEYAPEIALMDQDLRELRKIVKPYRWTAEDYQERIDNATPYLTTHLQTSEGLHGFFKRTFVEVSAHGPRNRQPIHEAVREAA
jgi:hypothetical protein